MASQRRKANLHGYFRRKKWNTKRLLRCEQNQEQKTNECQPIVDEFRCYHHFRWKFRCKMSQSNLRHSQCNATQSQWKFRRVQWSDDSRWQSVSMPKMSTNVCLVLVFKVKNKPKRDFPFAIANLPQKPSYDSWATKCNVRPSKWKTE